MKVPSDAKQMMIPANPIGLSAGLQYTVQWE
jgi:hypothetical protein